MKRIFVMSLIFSVFFACKKESIDNNTNKTATLQFSTDTVTFDTIFSSIGSITKMLTVYNNNSFDIKTNIHFKGISPGNFRINIDGLAGNHQDNIAIPANDSIFIFLEVTIDPTQTNTPYIIADTLMFTTGTKKQYVDIIAWGQDAYFHTANAFGTIIDGPDTFLFPYHEIDCTLPWEDDKPHVIYGYAIVNTEQILTINEGCNIYFHKNSGILVGNPFSGSSGSSIVVNGTLGNEVVFQGDRLDSWYTISPKPAGQWDRIWIMPGSVNNKINYAIIKNGNVGIHVDSLLGNETTIEINNTIIENMSAIGLLGQGARIKATNTIISECGQHTVACNIGGDYNFIHCNFINYWSENRRNTPSILLNNFYESTNGTIGRKLENAYFKNCIIDGSLSTEISFQNEEGIEFNYNFDHCLIKLDPNLNTNNVHYESVIINQSPDFISNTLSDFRLKEGSPCIDSGENSTEGSTDLEGNMRYNPDIGAYEFQ
tara:strand:- start:1121 stop:2578 length:1458 start_codon:yes stop_codon:yes gene_type:complete